jgi:predicted ATP-dependent endonuclease of OLD family
MELVHLKIENFRGIREGDIRFGRHSVLVGKLGKTGDGI